MHGTFAAFTLHRTVLAANRTTRELVHARMSGADLPLAVVHIPKASPYAFVLFNNPDSQPFAPRFRSPNSPIIVVHWHSMPGGAFGFREPFGLTPLIAALESEADDAGITYFAAKPEEPQAHNLVAIPDNQISASVCHQVRLIERVLATAANDILELLRDTSAEDQWVIGLLLMQTLSAADMDVFVEDLIGDRIKLNDFAAFFPNDPWAEKGLPAHCNFLESRGRPSGTTQPSIGVIGPELDRLASDGSGGEYVSLPHRCAVVARRAVTPRKDLCLVTCARDDGLHLLEWLAHHRSIGVELVFVYTNDNIDGSDELLRALAAAG